MTIYLPTSEHNCKLWSHFIENRITVRTVDCTLRMFFAVLSQNFKHDVEVINEWKKELITILYPLCCQLHVSNMRRAGYVLLIYCLGHENILDGKYTLFTRRGYTKQRNDSEIKDMSQVLLGLSYGQKKVQMNTLEPESIFSIQESTIVRVANYQISGLEKLWSIVIEANDQVVADMSMVYLAVLYTYTKYDKIHDEKAAESDTSSSMQIAFVHKCMEELNAEKQSERDTLKIERMLRQIRLFVNYQFVEKHFSASTLESG